MRNDGGGEGADAEEAHSGPTKRLRRPNVRLRQPYYENARNRRLQQQWNALKKDLDGGRKSRKSRTHKALNVRNSYDEGIEGLDVDGDDVAMGGWKILDTVKRNGDLKWKSKRKRYRPTSSKRWLSVEWHEEDGQENEHFAVSSGAGSAEQREGEKSLGDDWIGGNLEAEDSDHIGGSHWRMERGLRNGPDWDKIEGEAKKRGAESGGDGVRAWLNQLGLGKYASLFEVHEVDDEVLPFLTLEDLKDMGISAVGARRKMYTSIQKLGRGFS